MEPWTYSTEPAARDTNRRELAPARSEVALLLGGQPAIRGRVAEVLSDGIAAEKRLAELRAMYEPFVDGLSKRLLLPLPQWIRPPGAVDDWQTSAWDHFLEATPYTLDRAIQRD